MRTLSFGRRLRAGCVATGLGVVLLGVPLAASAQEGTPGATSFAIPANCSVVASGLYNPRGLTVGADSTLYIAEAGDGGSTPDYATPLAGTPAAEEPATTHGDTGRVTTVSPDGSQQVLVDGLTSYVFGTEVVGPSGVAVGDDGTVYVSIGGPGPQTATFPPADNANSVVSVDPTTGEVTDLANIGAYERSDNPDPYAIDSDVAGIALGTDGLLYVADAGGNNVYTVDPATGALTMLAVIPGLPSPGDAPNAARGGEPEIDPVPTNVVAAPDGGVYVGLLTGGALWGVPGSAKVIHVAADGTITDAATGLNMVVGVALGADGTIYASELSTNFFATPPAPGQVVRVTNGGTAETVLANLPFPYAIASASDGDLYVTINSNAQPGATPSGEVLKCDVGGGSTATPAASPVAGITDGAPVAATLDLIDIAFTPNALTIPVNTDVALKLTDTGISPHNFNIDALNIHSSTLQAGQSETVTINAPAGRYEFYCNLPGHEAAGMVGTLIVS